MDKIMPVLWLPKSKRLPLKKEWMLGSLQVSFLGFLQYPLILCIINPFYFYLQRGGVTALLAIKYDELLVGSGDGTVCIVVDQTTKPSSFKKPTHDGVPKTVSEPTKPCLREVLLLILMLFMKDPKMNYILW